MPHVYKNIEEYNLAKTRKVLIKLNPVVTELFIRGRKLSISIVFVTQSYFKVSKDVTLNKTYFLVIKIPNKRELQQLALNYSSDVDFKDFMKIYKKYPAKSYFFWLMIQLYHQRIL